MTRVFATGFDGQKLIMPENRVLTAQYNALEAAAANLGVTRTDPRYEAIAEGRGYGAQSALPYSWCGDYASFCWYSAGIRDPAIINRASVRGKWKPGENISSFYHGARKIGVCYLGNEVSSVWEEAPHALVGAALVIVKPNGDHIDIVKDWSVRDRPIVYAGNTVGGVSAERERVLGTGSGKDQIRFVTIMYPWALTIENCMSVSYRMNSRQYSEAIRARQASEFDCLTAKLGPPAPASEMTVGPDEA